MIQPNVQEGFLCPVCIIDLKSASNLKSHFDQNHLNDTSSDPNQAMLRPTSTPNALQVSRPQTGSFSHVFGVPNDPNRNIYDDADLAKQLCRLAGINEDTLNTPGQKEEIERFCRENDVASRLKRYMKLSYNPEWEMSIPSTRWYVDIPNTNNIRDRYIKNKRIDSCFLEDTNSNKTQTSIEPNSFAFCPDKYDHPSSNSINNKKIRRRKRNVKTSTLEAMLKSKDKPPLPPKITSNANPISQSTYGSTHRPPAPPISNNMSNLSPKDGFKQKGSSKLDISNDTIVQKQEITNSGSNSDDLFYALRTALKKIEEANDSETSSSEEESLLDDDW